MNGGRCNVRFLLCFAWICDVHACPKTYKKKAGNSVRFLPFLYVPGFTLPAGKRFRVRSTAKRAHAHLAHAHIHHDLFRDGCITHVLLLLSESVVAFGFRVIIKMLMPFVNTFSGYLKNFPRKCSGGDEERYPYGYLLTYRILLSVFFSMVEPMIWNSCTMMTISKTVTIITGVL